MPNTKNTEKSILENISKNNESNSHSSNKKGLFEKIESIAIDTGIPDLAENHDHYIYGVDKD